MKHRLFTILSALSLLLCAATVALWIYSYNATPGAVFEWIGRVSDTERFVERWGVIARCNSGGIILNSERARLDFDSFHRSGIDPHTYSGQKTWNPWPTPGRFPYPFVPSDYRGVPHHDYLGFAGFQACVSVSPDRIQYRTFVLVVPCWFLSAVTSLFPLWFLARAVGRFRQRKWLKQGLCNKCGYDLRATPDRCPECGAVPET
jgi:hypothetical protein